jgi:hypothetical protein
MSRVRTRNDHRPRGGAPPVQKRSNRPKQLAGRSPGAVAAERASAGMGTADAEPTDWLFGDLLTKGAATRR